ncbi:MAG: MBL fold metallo-hydrolase, partial [Lachnospiraceae bacterium]|nr:MBL fold metallo-hydrolase [Lachnospiraceae bacterium]
DNNDKKYPCKYDYERFYNIDIDKTYDLKKILGEDCDIKITANACPHDAPCVYYKLNIKDKNIVILTDCGYYDKKIINNLLDVDYLMLESNYDEELIETSIYPRFLIERIKGKGGHLSNDNAVSLLLDIINERLDTVCLSHISHNSNNEDNAYKYVTTNLNNKLKDKSYIPNIIVASRVKPTVIVDK